MLNWVTRWISLRTTVLGAQELPCVGQLAIYILFMFLCFYVLHYESIFQYIPSKDHLT